MTEADPLVLALGITGQALFTGRVLVQWVLSERARRVVVPRVFWTMGLVGAGFVLAYATLMRNPIYVFSVAPGAFVAARNLLLTHPSTHRQLVPWAVVLAGLVLWNALSRPRVGPPVWVAVGILGALLWSGRHLVQWWISERRGVSTLPRSFWLLSLAGGLTLSAYAIRLGHMVMLAGYAFGCVPYARNLVLQRREHAVVPPAAAGATAPPPDRSS